MESASECSWSQSASHLSSICAKPCQARMSCPGRSQERKWVAGGGSLNLGVAKWNDRSVAVNRLRAAHYCICIDWASSFSIFHELCWAALSQRAVEGGVGWGAGFASSLRFLEHDAVVMSLQGAQQPFPVNQRLYIPPCFPHTLFITSLSRSNHFPKCFQPFLKWMFFKCRHSDEGQPGSTVPLYLTRYCWVHSADATEAVTNSHRNDTDNR